MTYAEKKAADIASALGMVHDRNARALIEQLVRGVVEDCAQVVNTCRGENGIDLRSVVARVRCVGEEGDEL